MWRCPPAIAVMVTMFAVASAHAEITADFLMQTDPEFRPLDHVKDFKLDFKTIWRQALERPEADYQRLAAETVARAHLHGIPDLIELAPILKKLLASPSTHPTARFAAARALIMLESRESAPDLLKAGLSHGADLRQLVEPALATWNYGPAIDVWRMRVEAARVFPRDLVLALDGLGQVGDAQSLSTISKIALDVQRPAPIRLQAAETVGRIAESGLEPVAGQLSQDRRVSPLINRLCAVRILARHTSDAAKLILLELAGDTEPSVAAAAHGRLIEVDAEAVMPLVPAALTSSDPHVRTAGMNTYLKVPAPERIAPLAKLLDDDHPAVRQQVSEGLYRLTAIPELGGLIRSETMKMIASDRWQAQIEATLLLGMLEHQPAADRLIELLESDRPDVRIHAAWGLRKVAEPRTIPAIVEKIRQLTSERQRGVIPGVDEQVAHLFEACGRLQAKDAEPLMRQYVPRDVSRTLDFSRSAAIWALGRLHAGMLDEALADELLARALDESDKPPESLLVRQMAAVALARMKAPQYAQQLKNSIPDNVPALPYILAKRWAVQELTGEALPPPRPPRVPDGTWFLEPLDPSSDAR